MFLSDPLTAPRRNWAVLHAMIVTVAMIVVVELVRRLAPGFRSAGPALLFAVVYAACVAGLVPALIAAALTTLDVALWWSSSPLLPSMRAGGGGTPTIEADDAARMALFACAAVGAAILVGLLRQRAERRSTAAMARGMAAEHLRAEDAQRRASDLSRLADALRRSNDELDQFAYVTSHDLKAPLRGISNLSAWIEEDMGDRMTAEARQQMELLRGRVHRMENLIDGILEYSRIGRISGPIEDVDVAMLLAGVTDLLDPPTGFVIDVAPGMPRLKTDRLRLQQVFMNLIGNAIKHRGRRTREDRDGNEGEEGEEGARVQVSSANAGEFVEFCVRDNGPGISPKYHEKIFVIFQTLVPRDTIEGAGVGLSLVKKTVEHYGGRVRLESSEGAGSAFFFTWPKKISKQDAAASRVS